MEEFLKRIMLRCSKFLNEEQLKQLELELAVVARDYDITKAERALEVYNNEDMQAYQMFFVAKQVKNLSKRTLEVYKYAIDDFLRTCDKKLKDITTNDIRWYLALKKQNGVTNLDNIRRYLSSFFSWLEDEEYIYRNPVKKIGPIKHKKDVKKPFTEEELERIRQACRDEREKAVIEMLFSTGCRVSELSKMNRRDVDLNSKEAIVHGKGNKDRIVYLNAKAKVALMNYLDTRDDDEEPLFVSMDARHNRLLISWYENTIRELGEMACVDKAHPHKFRRTAATMALRRGMPIEQVKEMLGHENIDTTLIYAKMDEDELKIAHKKFMN